MTLGRSICRVAIYGGICLAASSASLLIEAAGFSFPKMLAGAIASVVAGNTANAIDNFDPSRPDYVGLQNEDLIRVSGKAIAQIISIASENRAYNDSTRNHLKKIAAKATEAWVSLASSEFANSKYKELTEGEIPLIITPTETGLTQAKILTDEEWRTIFAKLDLMAVDSAKGVNLTSDVRQDVAELLQKEFPRVLREALKQDFKADGKAFAGLMIQLLTGIRQEVLTSQRKIRKHRKTSLTLLKELRQLKKQLTGSEQEIQTVFIAISEQMQTGFDKLCQEFGVVETNINKTLQQLQDVLTERLDEQSQKLDYIMKVIQPHPRESIENKLLKALLQLDYDRQANLFKEFVENNQIGACLIHGSSETAPRWLLNRLIRNVPNGQTSNCGIKIKFFRRTHNSSLDSFFQEISRKLEIDQTSSVPAIHHKICSLWQSQTVILIIENTQDLEESYLEGFLKIFWKPLANLASQTGTTNENYSLLLFLLDEDGFTNDWQITYTQDPTSDLIPQTLIKFMEIQPIQRRQLSTWLELYPCAENLLQYTESLVDEVFRENVNGFHKDILEKICSLCQIKWDDYESQWLKY